MKTDFKSILAGSGPEIKEVFRESKSNIFGFLLGIIGLWGAMVTYNGARLQLKPIYHSDSIQYLDEKGTPLSHEKVEEKWKQAMGELLLKTHFDVLDPNHLSEEGKRVARDETNPIQKVFGETKVKIGQSLTLSNRGATTTTFQKIIIAIYTADTSYTQVIPNVEIKVDIEVPGGTEKRIFSDPLILEQIPEELLIAGLVQHFLKFEPDLIDLFGANKDFAKYSGIISRINKSSNPFMLYIRAENIHGSFIAATTPIWPAGAPRPLVLDEPGAWTESDQLAQVFNKYVLSIALPAITLLLALSIYFTYRHLNVRFVKALALILFIFLLFPISIEIGMLFQALFGLGETYQFPRNFNEFFGWLMGTSLNLTVGAIGILFHSIRKWKTGGHVFGTYFFYFLYLATDGLFFFINQPSANWFIFIIAAVDFVGALLLAVFVPRIFHFFHPSHDFGIARPAYSVN